jgi:hypothetical protein
MENIGGVHIGHKYLHFLHGDVYDIWGGRNLGDGRDFVAKRLFFYPISLETYYQTKRYLYISVI